MRTKLSKLKPTKQVDVLDPRRIHQDFFHISRDRGRAFQRSSVRELHIDVGIALIFVGKEARRDSVGKKATRHAKDHKQHDHDDGLSDQYCAPTHIALGGSLKDAVEPIEKSSAAIRGSASSA